MQCASCYMWRAAQHVPMPQLASTSPTVPVEVTATHYASGRALQAMEGLVREGLVRTIGTSNFGAKKLAEILSYAEIPPAVCQVGWVVLVAFESGTECGAMQLLPQPLAHAGTLACLLAPASNNSPCLLNRWRCTRTTATTRCWPFAPSTPSTSRRTRRWAPQTLPPSSRARSRWC